MFYAIRSIEGKEVNLILSAWGECSKLVLNKKSIYKSFTKEEDARQFLISTPVKNEDYGHGYEPININSKRIIAKFKFLRYHNEENNYTIAVYENTKGNKITCRGYGLPTNKKITYALYGQYINVETHGYQYDVDTYDELITDSKRSIVSYLSSGLIKGVGPKIAEAIYEKFRGNSLYVIEHEPEKLDKIKGISKKKREEIVTSYKEHAATRELVSFLLPFGISAKKSLAVYKVYKGTAVEKIKENPYILCDFYGITFLDADEIAKKEQFPLDSDERFFHAAMHVLKRNEVTGSTCMEVNEFGRQMFKLLNTSLLTPADINEKTIQLIRDHTLRTYRKDEKCYLIRKNIYEMEEKMAIKTIDMIELPEKKCDKLEETIDEISKREGISLHENQKIAVKEVMLKHFLVITGFPGTGKTTSIKILYKVYKHYFRNNDIYFFAPTGRAARKIAEATGMDASTLHSGLRIFDETLQESSEDDVVLSNCLVLVDEFSMVNVYVHSILMNSLGENCTLVLIGDEKQLPSVGPGAVLQDLLESKVVPTVALTKIFRQNEGTVIFENNKKMREGNADISEGHDFVVHELSSLEDIRNQMAEDYVKKVEEYGLENVMCLCPFIKHTAGTEDMNILLQEKVNPPAADKAEYVHGNTVFRMGDLVMNLRNDEEASNGDLGIIEDMEKEEDNVTIYVKMNGIVKEYRKDNLECLTLAYAMSIHKAQGSEADAVLTCLTSYHKPMLYRSIPYVSLSRPKKSSDFYGEKDVLKQAIMTERKEERITMFPYFLRKHSGKVFVPLN